MESEEKVYPVYVTEKLQRELEISGGDCFEALEEAERLYNEGEVVLDYSDLASTEFTSDRLSRKEMDILGIIGEECRACPTQECGGQCPLHKIEEVIKG